jgi:hypothetical protein
MFDPSVNASFRTMARKDAKDRSVRNQGFRYIDGRDHKACPSNITGARQSLLDSLATRRQHRKGMEGQKYGEG